jgi:hypothetical protein
MAAVVFRCPNTGLNVHGWIADDPAGDAAEVCEAVTCTALVARDVRVMAALGGKADIGQRARYIRL